MFFGLLNVFVVSFVFAVTRENSSKFVYLVSNIAEGNGIELKRAKLYIYIY